MSGPAIDMFYDENSEQNIESSDNSTSVVCSYFLQMFYINFVHFSIFLHFYCQVVDWLNQASLADTTEKVTLIKKIQEYILHKEPSLAKTYLDNILDFCADPIQDVKKAVVAFIEDLW